MPKTMVASSQPRTIEDLAAELRDVQIRLESAYDLLQVEERLREEIESLMIDQGLRKTEAEGYGFTIATRKVTSVMDEEQVRRTLTARGLLEDCLRLDTTRIRNHLGEDALGLETTERKYIVVRDNIDRA